MTPKQTMVNDVAIDSPTNLNLAFFERVVSETDRYHQFSSTTVIQTLQNVAEQINMADAINIKVVSEIEEYFKNVEITRSALGVLAEIEELYQVEENKPELHLEDYHENDPYEGLTKMEVADIAYYLARLIINLDLTEANIMENKNIAQTVTLIDRIQAMRNLLRPKVSEKNYKALKQAIPHAIKTLEAEMDYYELTEDNILELLHTKLSQRWQPAK